MGLDGGVALRLVVVGGGIAGLAAARRLRERAGDAAEITVVEGAPALGGKLRTGDLAEAGAEMFLVRERGAESEAWRLAVRLGLDLVHPAPVPAALAIGGTLRPMPGGTLLGIPADPSTVESVARAEDRDHDRGHPLLGPGEDVAVGDLVRRRLGDDVVDRLVEPLLGGVYAGRADALSLAATMPGLHAAAQVRTTLRTAVADALAASPRPPGAPVFAAVRGGLSRLVEAVAASARGRVRLGVPARELTRVGAGWRVVIGPAPAPEPLPADGVVLAVPATPAARLLRDVDLGVAEAIGSLEYASVALVTLALPPGTALPELSGFLVPATEGYAVKAATFVSMKWPHLRRADAPVPVRVSLGRHGEEHVVQRPDEELVALARSELSALLGTDLPDPVATAVHRWGGALPQYGVGHVARVARARAGLPATLGLAGAAYDGVGIAACVRSGQAAADAVCDALFVGTLTESSA
jgi:protoporphyrinogen/coproporphyrinogen III oxidase